MSWDSHRMAVRQLQILCGGLGSPREPQLLHLTHLEATLILFSLFIQVMQ
jgi:hypothetical protein